MEFDFLAVAIEGPIPEPKKAPKPGLYPNFITKKGEALWDQVLKDFSATIKAQDTKGRQWAAAILLFKQEALKAKIPAFKKAEPSGKGQHARELMLKSLRKKVNVGRMKTNKHVSNVFQRLERRGMIQTPTKAKLEDVGEQAGRYYLLAKRSAKLESTIKPQWILDELKTNWKYRIDQGNAYRQIDAVTDILFDMTPRKVDVYVTTFFTKAQVLAMLELLDAKVSKDKILRGLKKLGKNWVSDSKRLEAQVGGMTLASWIGNELLPTMDEAREDKVNLKDRNRLLDWLKLKKYAEVLRYVMRLNDREYKRLMDLVYQ